MENPKPNIPNNPTTRRRLIFFVGILVLAMFPVSIYFFRTAKKIETEVNQTQEQRQLEEMMEEEEDIDRPEPEKVKGLVTEGLVIDRLDIHLPTQPIPASVEVYWNTDAAYLQINSLAKLPQGHKYEVWSIAERGRKSLGLYDAPDNGKLIVVAEKALMNNKYDIRVVRSGN